jgi:hypothetical protein
MTTPIRTCLLIAALFVALTPNAGTSAQTRQATAEKFDEFGDIQASDLIARLDNLAIQLQNRPDVKAFLIVYRTRRDLPGLSNRYAQRMKGYLMRSRGVDAERIVAVDGGVASCLTQQLWIVPPGTTPTPLADAYDNSYQSTVFKFDEHSYGETEGDLYYWRDSAEELLEAFGLELQKHPKSTGYLVAFRKTPRDSTRVAQTALAKERRFLIKGFGIKPGRLKTVVSGFRAWPTIELWVAKEPGAAPVITSYRLTRVK